MTLPKISIDVVDATTAKVLQNHTKPELFAMETMMDLMAEQPALFSVLNSFMQQALAGGDEVDEVPASFAQEMMLQSCFVGVGLALKAMNAQVEADELNEAWGE
jgi:hypothetical protein